MLQELKKAFKTGKTRGVEFRIQQLESLVAALEENKKQIVEAITKDTGRSFGES